MAKKASGDVLLELDERNPSEFFQKLKWLSISNEWTADMTRNKCLLFIGLKQTWLAAKLEKEVVKQTGTDAPTIERLQELLETIVAPRSVRHTYIDEFEKITLNDRSVFEVREQLENNFRLALPEAETNSVDLMVKRQLIKACPAAWQQRLKEAEFKDVDALCEKIYMLQKVTEQAPSSGKKEPPAGGLVRATKTNAKCDKCGLLGHLAKDCRTRCFKCKQKGHIRSKCPDQTVTTQKTEPSPPKSDTNEKTRRVELLLEDAVLVKSLPEESEITVDLFVEGTLQPALVDCGSFYNLITLKTLKLLKAQVKPQKTTVRLGAVNKTALKVLGEVSLKVELGTRETVLDFIVVEDMSDELIIGKQGADSLKIVVWFQARRTKESECKLQELGTRFENLFAKDQFDVGRLELEHRIELSSDAPVVKAQYKVPIHYQERAKVTLEKMVDAQLIQEGDSKYSSPALMVPKGKSEELRLVIDYRELNKITVEDPFPIPDMLNVVNQAARFELFSALDIRGGYWHFQMAAEDRHKTAFVILDKQYVCNAMPMGLKNAPKTFARGLQMSTEQVKSSLTELKLRSGVHYVVESFYDDVVIATNTEEVHLQVLEELLKRFAEDGWKLNKDKCKWLVEQVEILGHTVAKNSVKPRKCYEEEMASWEVPEDQKELRTFLGFAGFHSRMIPNYSEIAGPLNRLLGDVPFEWTSREDKAFEKLKQLLSSEPVIRPFDKDLPIVLTTDASGGGWGAVLEQGNQPVEYCSGRWNPTEEKWSTTRKEFKALVNAIGKWKYYLVGAEFTVITDHQAIAKGFRLDCDDPVLYRWARKLDGYSMKIQHRPGSTIAHADALSRKPCVPHRRISRVDSWIDECRKDETLNYLRKLVAGKSGKPPSNMANSEVLFWRKELAGNSLRVENDNVFYRNLKIVPLSMREEIFKAAHCHPMTGHMGSKRTYRRIREFYFWFHMGEDIKRMKRLCLICAKNDIKRQAHGEPRRSMEVENVPLCQWSMDFLGPLPQTRKGNRHILVVSDLVTKWVELYPTESQTAKETVKVITDLVLRYSVPSCLLTDQGTNFMADLTQSLMKALNIRPIRTSPYHPQTDGQTERYNATLTQYLRKFVGENPEDWDRHLQFAAYAYRTSKHSVTGFSPYELVFGRKPRDPVLLMSDESDAQLEEVDRMKAAEEWRKLAFERIVADKKSRTDELGEPHYSEGDLVMLKVFNKTKLDPPYRGPFVVTDVAPPNYELEVNGRKRVFHGEHLKLFLRRGEIDYVDTRLPEPEERIVHSEDEQEEPDLDLDSSRELLDDSREESREDSRDEPREDQEEEIPEQAAPTGRLGFLNRPSLSKVFSFLPATTASGREVKPNPRYQ